MCSASSPPMRMRIISAPSRRLWPLLHCPLYATPFTARLIEGKLDEAGLRDQVQVKDVPLGGQLDARARSRSISSPSPIRSPSPTRSRSARRWASWSTPATGRSIPIRCWARPPTTTRSQKLGDEGVLALVCDSTNALVPGSSGSEATVRESLTELIGTLKGRVAVTGFASNVARLDTVAQRRAGAWPPASRWSAARCTRSSRRRARPAI